MIVCHITSAHNTNDVRIFLKECSSLAKNVDYDVFLVGPGSNRKENNVNIIGAGKIPSSRIVRMLFFTRKVVKSAKLLNASVYHLHDPELLRYAMQLKKTGAHVIFDSHENILDSIDEKLYMPRPIRIIAKKYFSILQKKIYPKLDALVVVSPQMVASYSKFNDTVEMITNYPIIPDEMRETEFEEQQGSIIFAGGISKQWSHKEIVEALKGTNGLHYYTYGAADLQYLEELLSKGEDNFTYGGVICFDEVQKKMKNSEIAVALLKPGKNTFFQEGTLGNTKLFEAMLNMKPVIATNFKLWKQIIEDNNCGICVDPDSVEEIRGALEKVHSMSVEERKEMGMNGKKTVIERFNWASEEAKLMKLYNSL